MTLVKIKDYKVAKKFVTDSEQFFKAIDLSMKALEHYKYYKPIAKILYEMQDQRAILDAHYTTAKKILSKED